MPAFRFQSAGFVVLAAAMAACGEPPEPQADRPGNSYPEPVAGAAANPDAAGTDGMAWVGARIWTGADAGYLDNAVLLVRNGRIEDVFSLDDRDLPDNVEVRDVSGRYLVPGLINAHGHVGMARGLETGPDIHSRDNVEAQLRLYARYGVTTVVSLGDEPPQAFDVRTAVTEATHPDMARLFLAGDVLEPDTPDEARDAVQAHAELDPDWIKIRVDDQLGTREAMPEPVFGALIDEASELSFPVASHMVTLEDSKALLRAGTGLLAHSVRDAPVDSELIRLMRARDICITPTLTREVSVFIYAVRPDFFDDPFFLKAADPEVLETLQQPEVQARFTGRAADYYREALPLAKDNMMRLHEAGIRVAMGTDSGPPARFQGYFEHMEMAMMQSAGMSAEEVLRSATRHAADCMGIGDELGSLEPGKRADFLVLSADPLEDVHNLRELEAIHVGGVTVSR